MPSVLDALERPEFPLRWNERLVDCQRSDRAIGGGSHGELRAGHDVTSGEAVPHRGVVGLVHDDVATRVADAVQLRAEVVGWILADGEEDLVGIERQAALEGERVHPW